MRRLIGSAVWAAAAVSIAVACSFSAGTSVSVDRRISPRRFRLNSRSRSGARRSPSTAPTTKGEVGATTRCTLTDAGETYGVNVNVTKVDGTDVKFDLKVDHQPQ